MLILSAIILLLIVFCCGCCYGYGCGYQNATEEYESSEANLMWNETYRSFRIHVAQDKAGCRANWAPINAPHKVQQDTAATPQLAREKAVAAVDAYWAGVREEFERREEMRTKGKG